jgi:hypothetical protein
MHPQFVVQGTSRGGFIIRAGHSQTHPPEAQDIQSW